MTNIFYWTMCLLCLALTGLIGTLGYIGTMSPVLAGFGCIAALLCGWLCAWAADDAA